MITRDQAERIAAELTGGPPGDPGRDWELREFSAGWLLVEYPGQGHRGAAARVIERGSGRVIRFPSFIPPGRITADYATVIRHGRPDEHQCRDLETGQQLCVHCGREVLTNRDSYNLLERMHYVCFHYVFEHTGPAPDEPCDAGGCPASSPAARREEAAPDDGHAGTGAAAVSGRRVRLLAVVAEGGGNWDARRIDLAVSARFGPAGGTVLQELQALQQLGLVARDGSRSGPGGRWAVTAAARPYLE